LIGLTSFTSGIANGMTCSGMLTFVFARRRGCIPRTAGNLDFSSERHPKIVHFHYKNAYRGALGDMKKKGEDLRR
jgi:hypothetical protein